MGPHTRLMDPWAAAAESSESIKIKAEIFFFRIRQNQSWKFFSSESVKIKAESFFFRIHQNQSWKFFFFRIHQNQSWKFFSSESIKIKAESYFSSSVMTEAVWKKYFEIRGKYARNIALAGVWSLKVDISRQQSSYQTWPENISEQFWINAEFLFNISKSLTNQNVAPNVFYGKEF